MISEIILDGTWGFRFDGAKEGISRRFFTIPYEDTIELPSTTSLSRKGVPSDERKLGSLTDEYSFEGYCWYYRTIETGVIPEDAKAELFLERTRQTKLWVNGDYIGERNSLCTPHIYDITDRIKDGTAEICVMVSNTGYPTKGGHMTSEDTQTNWNGITGRIALRISEKNGISFIRAYPCISSHSVKLEFGLEGLDEAEISIWGVSSACDVVDTTVRKISADSPFTVIDLGEDVSLWDEYSPVIYTLKAAVNGSMDIHTVCFGMREFRADGMHFSVNGKPAFLRGKHDGMLFPLTGAAPATVGEWYEVLRKAKEWGINHYRFHTCCPPDAAFTAADMLGIYMQPELPFWGTIRFHDEEGYNADEIEYLREEGRRILRTFGNHPSFVMMSLGNELWGDYELMDHILAEYKAMDDRHLYTQGSNNFQFCPRILENDDFFSGVRLGEGRFVRGSFAECDPPHGFVQAERPNTAYSFDRNILTANDSAEGPAERLIQIGTGTAEVRAESHDSLVPHIPIVSHETGQYYSYPDLDSAEKYTGPLKAHFLDEYRQRLDEKGMGTLYHAFHEASGLFAFQCYKIEIEAAMRSELLAGFQLLDLQDFTGQGVASVGMLDSFMDEKSFVTENDLRSKWLGFCSDSVLLAEIDTFVLEYGQKVTIPVYLRYMRPDELNGAKMSWRIGDKSGEIAVPDDFRGIGRIGNITFEADLPIESELQLTIDGVTSNSYSFTTFPAADKDFTLPEVSERSGSHVYICDNIEKAEKLLENGEKVILFTDKLRESVKGFYCTDFWNYPMFRTISQQMGKEEPVGTLGLLIQNDHPALAGFPCSTYSTPQWYEIVTHSESAVLDGTPEVFRPIVQVIDNCERNHKLGLLFEACISKGKLLVCTCRIREIIHRPEVQHFVRSLLDYAHSDSFDPTYSLTAEALCLR